MRRRTLVLMTALAAAVSLLATVAPAGASAVPTYYPSGPQANVDESSLVGWRQCWSGTYTDRSALADVLAACDGDHLLLAAGPIDSTVFDVVAAAPRDDVLFETGTGNSTHVANGVGWYFDDSSSWGFAPAGARVVRNPCDVVGSSLWPDDSGGLRVCWHTQDGFLDAGWRSGTHDFLNESNAFRRAIYVEAPDRVPPTIRAAVSAGTSGSNGWYTSDVTVSFTCSDEVGGSGIPVGACPADQTLSAEGAAVASVAKTVADAAGNVSDPSNVVSVSIDKTPPTLNPAVPGPVYLGSTVEATPGATDTVSGVDSATCSAVDTSSLGPKSLTCSGTDQAGNVVAQVVSYTVVARVPLASQDCKGSGWRTRVDATGRAFRNQGDCVSWVATKARNGASG